MIEVTASYDIDAPAEAVWSVLTDLSQFHVWNPFIQEASGSTELGGTVRVRVRPSLRIPLGFRAKIYDREPNRWLRWRGHVGAPWLASGDHSFTIEPLADGRSRLVQRETFTGALPWLTRRLLAREAQRGFDAMNRALADRAHSASMAAGPPPRAAQAAPPVAAQAPSSATTAGVVPRAACPGTAQDARSATAAEPAPATSPAATAATPDPGSPAAAGHRLTWPQHHPDGH